jgi:protoheme IX farnesyltransferase
MARTAPATPAEVGSAPPAEFLASARRVLALAADYVALGKPRIVLLLVLTSLCAMVVAAHGLPPIGRALLTLTGLALSAAGANAVNMWYDRDIDPLMARTRHRPLPAGRLRPGHALAFGVATQAVAIPLLAWAVNPQTAGLTLAGALYYVFVYTMWLKRRTPQNIVIGGAAGAFPPLVGWAAVRGGLAWPAWLMFLIVFLWTPPHFWSLALYRQDDYRRAGVPMMPVACGARRTKMETLAYTVLLVAASVALFATGAVGRWYLAAACALGLGFLVHAVALWREPDARFAWAKRTFHFSLLYLTILFAVMVFNVRAA